uniref:DUF2180 family protein n=1 Tax=Knipowitschia caucasica TaxID=637954 RepID=A0AAV2J5J2_KNICA
MLDLDCEQCGSARITSRPFPSACPSCAYAECTLKGAAQVWGLPRRLVVLPPDRVGATWSLTSVHLRLIHSDCEQCGSARITSRPFPSACPSCAYAECTLKGAAQVWGLPREREVWLTAVFQAAPL